MKFRKLVSLFLIFSSINLCIAQSFDEFKTNVETHQDPKKAIDYIKSINTNNWSEEEKGRYYYEYGLTLEKAGEIDKAMDMMNQSISLLQSLKPTSSYWVHALIDRSYLKYIKFNEPSSFCPDRMQAVDISRTIDDKEALIRSLVHYAFCFEKDRENFNKGIDYLEEALQLTMGTDLAEKYSGMIHNASGNLYRTNQIHNKAYDHLLLAYQAWEKKGDVLDMFNMQHSLLGESLELAKWELARQHVDKLYELAEKNPEQNDFLFFAHFNKARMLYAQNLFAEASKAFEECLQLQDTTQEKYFVSQSKRLLSEALFRNGQFAEAANWAKEHAKDLPEDRLSNSMLAIMKFDQGNYASAMEHVWKLKDVEKTSRLKFTELAALDQARNLEKSLAEFKNQVLEQQLSINSLQLSHEQNRNRISNLTNTIFGLLALIFIASSIYLFKSRKFFQRHAQTDFLTGIHNRRFTFEQAHLILKESKKLKLPMSLIVFDVDEFKQVNDTYGHDVGDQVLKKLAKESRALLNEKDIIGRIGGEEFMLVLKNTNKKQAMEFAESLRGAIEELKISCLNQMISVTVSMGVASIDSAVKSMDELFKQADNALYLAKKQGRNQVQVV